MTHATVGSTRASRAQFGLAIACACTLSACQLVFPLHESDDAAPADATADATLDAGADATAEASADADGSDEARVQDNTTVFCGPDLECSRSNPTIACCVLYTDSGLPPENYRYECVGESKCALDQGRDSGNASMLACDDGTDCPDPTGVCCWANTQQPRNTYCFAATATNCTFELCNPDAPTPCINIEHLGWKCVPSGSVSPFEAPLGYHVCVPPDGG